MGMLIRWGIERTLQEIKVKEYDTCRFYQRTATGLPERSYGTYCRGVIKVPRKGVEGP